MCLSSLNALLCGQVWPKLGSPSEGWRIGRSPEPMDAALSITGEIRMIYVYYLPSAFRGGWLS